MTIGIFHPKRNIKRLDDVMDAVILGFMDATDMNTMIHVVRSEYYEPCDVAIRWGISNNKIRTRYRALIDEQHKGPIGIIELGWLGDRMDTYFQFGFNGLSGRATYYLPSKDVMEQRFKKLNIPIPKQRKASPDDYILLCGQVPWDTSVQHINYVQWVYDTARKLLDMSELPIVYRPHPHAIGTVSLTQLHEWGVKISRNNPLQKDLSGARCVVTFNSNSALDALLVGTPAITFDEGSMVYGITDHNLLFVDNPYYPFPHLLERRLLEIANSQWTHDEFKKNIPWQIAKKKIQDIFIG